MAFQWPADLPHPVKMGSREHEDDDGIDRYLELDDDTEIILTEEEFKRAKEEGLKALAEILDDRNTEAGKVAHG